MNTGTIVILLFLVAAVLIYLAQKQGNDIPEPTQVQEMMNENPGVVIDVRTRKEYQDGHLKEADYQFDLLSGEFEEKLSSLDKDNTYYLYCRTGNRSGKAANLMKERGFDKVYNIGGYHSLVEGGFESAE